MSDPLSDVLALLQMESVATARLETGGAWAMHFPARAYIKFNAVLHGHCFITPDGQAPRRLEAGDTFLMSGAEGYTLSDAAVHDGVTAADGPALFAAARQAQGNCVRYGGADTILVGGGFVFGANNAALLLDMLPAFLLIPGGDSVAAILRNTLALLDAELSANDMGASLVTRHLADILLVQALRAYVTLHGVDSAGWFGALGDSRVGGALRAMHRDPRRRWSVAALAALAGMSRSGFALRFKERVGSAPLAYLTHWRMQLARSALRSGNASVAMLAEELGYASESAFGNAFKRHFGRSPRRYWQELPA
jgi:AraC-like DNA-binding protein